MIAYDVYVFNVYAIINVCMSWVSSRIKIHKNIFFGHVLVWRVVFVYLLFVDFRRPKRKKDKARMKDTK